jgi:hypothetical protein
VGGDEWQHLYVAKPSRKKMTLWLVGVAVLVVSPFVLTPQQHVIDCGVDENGRPYAKVLVMNLLGGYHNANWTGVNFHYKGLKKYDSTGFERPAHSITTTVVHAHKFPRDLSGRTVSCSTWKNY